MRIRPILGLALALLLLGGAQAAAGENELFYRIPSFETAQEPDRPVIEIIWSQMELVGVERRAQIRHHISVVRSGGDYRFTYLRYNDVPPNGVTDRQTGYLSQADVDLFWVMMPPEEFQALAAPFDGNLSKEPGTDYARVILGSEAASVDKPIDWWHSAEGDIYASVIGMLRTFEEAGLELLLHEYPKLD